MMRFVKFLRFLRLKLRRKRVAERVAAVDTTAEDVGGSDCKPQKCKGIQKLLFSWEEIQRFTMNFSFVIGHGGFSTVYLAQFPDSSTAAVKIQFCSSERLNQAYKQELQILLHLDHPNIVKLLGHCDDREEGILILEYAANGTLHQKLHGSHEGLPAGLSWRRRMAIAFQLAEAIEYLHQKCIIHGDIKASNILLDEQLKCKLCDFGSAKMGFSSLVHPPSSRIMMQGSPGYTDPHYLRTGLASKKNDVYSFGVIVLELISGMEALDPLSEERLTIRAETILRDVEKAVDMVDPRLRVGEDFDLEEAKAMTAVAALCL